MVEIEKVSDTEFNTVEEVKTPHTVDEIKADIEAHEAEIEAREENKANAVAIADAAIADAQATIAADEALLVQAEAAGVQVDPVVEPTPEVPTEPVDGVIEEPTE